MNRTTKGRRRLAGFVLMGMLAGACAQPGAPSSRRSVVDSGHRSASTKTPILLAAKPNPAATELSLSVAGGSCGGDSAATRLDHVEVEETAQAVTVTAFTYIDNPLPKGANCGGVGLTIPVQAVLKQPLGARDLLDGACTPPVAVLVVGESRSACQPPAPLPAEPQTIGHWEAVDAGPLATRGEPKMVWTGSEVDVVGGLIIDQYQALSDGAAFNPTTNQWRRIANRPAPGRVLDVAWTGTEMITLGSDGIGLDTLTTAFAYNPATDHWRTIPLPPSRKTPHTLLWTGKRVLAWQPAESPPGALYDPTTNRWSPIPNVNVPGVASLGAATWTGHELAIEGSVTPDHGGAVEQRLMIFDPDRSSWRVSSKPPSELAMWPFLIPGSAGGQAVIVGNPNFPTPQTPRPQGQGSGTTLIYNPASDTWRTTTAPFQNASTFTELPGGRLVEGTGPLFILDTASASWSTTGAPPGPPVSDGLVAAGTQAFTFGITNDQSTAQAQSPNGAYLWSP